MLDCESLGKIIREHRKEEKLTQKDLASLLCVSDKAVSKWECGKCYPDISVWEDLSRILNIPVEKMQIVTDDTMAKKSNKAKFVILLLSLLGFLVLVVCLATNLKFYIKRIWIISIASIYYFVLAFALYMTQQKDKSKNTF
jgi:transcriptional regulator with XRE-family HTH domain